MKKKSHMLLGRFLMDELQSAPAQRYRKAFLFGCVQPDYNLLTYLKGSLRERFIDGHNFINTKRCISRYIDKLQHKKGWLMLKYYRLGKLIHYLADAFTAPHNCSFSAADHIRYEIEMHIRLEEGIAAIYGTSTESSGSSIIEFILSRHRQYIDSIRNLETDITYILGGADMVFKLLLPEEELTGMKQAVFSTLSA